MTRWAGLGSRPLQFESAVYALADELDQAAALISFGLRREALRSWSIDTSTWADLMNQTGLRHRMDEPRELADRWRQTGSMLVWTRVTQGEHIHAPTAILDGLPREQQRTGRQSAYSTIARLRLGVATDSDLKLKAVLDKYANELARRIDASLDPSADTLASRLDAGEPP